MDELDLTSAEAKATYKEIEEWVQENYGFLMGSLPLFFMYIHGSSVHGKRKGSIKI